MNPCESICYGVLHTVSSAYPPVTGKLLTRYAPFRRSPPKYCYLALPLDLHVLSLPLAFILSQDQTLLCIFFYTSSLLLTLYQFPKKSTLSILSFSVLACTYLVSLFNELFSNLALKKPASSADGQTLSCDWDCKGNHFF